MGRRCDNRAMPWPRPRSQVISALLLLLAPVPAACDFFHELDDADSAGTGTGGTDTGTGSDTDTAGSTGTGPCSVASDDRCLTQDALQSCDEASGELSSLDCGDVCGSFVNFTCIDTPSGQHGCWCVEPGAQKVYACWELESCLQGCTWDTTGECANQCFARTTAATVRMYGALVHCARSYCEQVCADAPDTCGGCLDDAMAGLAGDCAVPRSVCDNDQNDEWQP